jgi:hypothetical protein
MKKVIVPIIATVLLFSCCAMASAEILFGVSAETGHSDFSADYRDAGRADVAKSPTPLILNGEINLLITRIFAEYNRANLEHSSFSGLGLRAGWEIGPPILKARLSAGYQEYTFSDQSLPAHCDNTYRSLVAGVGVESKIAGVTIYGETLLPLITGYSNGSHSDNGAGLDYLRIGASYSPLPTIDLFVNYREMGAKSDVVTLDSSGYSAGIKFSF